METTIKEIVSLLKNKGVNLSSQAIHCFKNKFLIKNDDYFIKYNCTFFTKSGCFKILDYYKWKMK